MDHWAIGLVCQPLCFKNQYLKKIALLKDPLHRHTFSFIEVYLHLKSSDGAKRMYKICLLYTSPSPRDS